MKGDFFIFLLSLQGIQEDLEVTIIFLSILRHVFLCHAKDNQDNFNVFQFFLSSYRIQEDYLLYIIILFYNVVIVQALSVDIG